MRGLVEQAVEALAGQLAEQPAQAEQLGAMELLAAMAEPPQQGRVAVLGGSMLQHAILGAMGCGWKSCHCCPCW